MDKLLVQQRNTSTREPLNCLLIDSFYIQWDMNQDYQIQLTAYDDGSLAYNMLDSESMLFWQGQEFIIKQCVPDFSKGVSTKSITATHIMYECGRVFQYNVNSGTKSYSVNDVLAFYFNGNKIGFNYKVIGNFQNAQIQDLGNGSGKDCLTKITSTWPDAIIWPDNYCICVYSRDAFEKDNGNRIDYLHDSEEVKLTYDSTTITNYTKCISGTHTVTETKTTTSTTTVSDGAAKVQADARKYLGVPYVWGGSGGARGGNPFNGMDCSSFVSQVYKDFGINIPAYTVSMESCGYQVPLSQVQTGDMLFYGPHGATHHIALALDNKNMIFEPQPGESCKQEPISYYPPSWALRNAQMNAIVTGSHQETTTSTETDDKDVKWFNDFFVQNDDSVKKWGIHPMPAISDDRFHDANSAKQYALSQMQPEPTLSIDVTNDTNVKPQAGELRHLFIKPANLTTVVAVVGYQWYPLSKTQNTKLTLNNTAKTIFDYQTAHQNSIKNAIQNIQNSNNAAIDSVRLNTINAGESVISYD